MSVPVIMKSVIFKVRLLGNAAPELLDVLQRLTRHVARKQVLLPLIRTLPHLSDQS